MLSLLVCALSWIVACNGSQVISCDEIFKGKVCRRLSQYCKWDRKSGCSDLPDAPQLPLKELCEAHIGVRKACQQFFGQCFWTGYECMLWDGVSCSSIEKRRICMNTQLGNICYGGHICEWKNGVCVNTSTCADFFG